MDIILAFAGQLSQHLRSLRKLRGLTQSELTARIGVAQSRVALVEKNAAKLTAAQLLRWLAALEAELVLRVPRAPAQTMPDASADATAASPVPSGSAKPTKPQDVEDFSAFGQDRARAPVVGSLW